MVKVSLGGKNDWLRMLIFSVVVAVIVAVVVTVVIFFVKWFNKKKREKLKIERTEKRKIMKELFKDKMKQSMLRGENSKSVANIVKDNANIEQDPTFVSKIEKNERKKQRQILKEQLEKQQQRQRILDYAKTLSNKKPTSQQKYKEQQQSTNTNETLKKEYTKNYTPVENIGQVVSENQYIKEKIQNDENLKTVVKDTMKSISKPTSNQKEEKQKEKKVESFLNTIIDDIVQNQNSDLKDENIQGTIQKNINIQENVNIQDLESESTPNNLISVS